MNALAAVLALVGALDVPLAAEGEATAAPPPPPPPVLRMEGSTAPPAAAPGQNAAAPERPPAPVARHAPVFLTINSNRADVKLLRADDDAVACTVPCNQLVPAGPKDIYYLGGKGIANSSEFDLADGIKAAQVELYAGTKAGKIAGIILTALGGMLLINGGTSMLSWGIQQDPAIQAQYAQSGTQPLISPTVSLVLALLELGVGAASFTTGVILWPTNSTRMKLKVVEPPGQPVPPPPPAEVPQPPGVPEPPAPDAPPPGATDAAPALPSPATAP